MVNDDFTDDDLAAARQSARQAYQNELPADPLHQAIKLKLQELLNRPYYSPFRYLELIDNPTLDDLLSLRNTILSDYKSQTLVYGNIKAKVIF